MKPVWRLLIDGPVDGALNMALDRAALQARDDGAVAPTLRLYGWARPTVTIGRFQGAEGVDRDYCAAEGIDVVRRPTGGRGVLHDDEVTYALIASADDGIPRGVAASYRHLSAALAEAYRLLGVDAALVHHDRTDTATAACYLSTTRADLSLGPLKLSGSAQVWSGATVLQHGSFTRSRDIGREARAFMLDTECAQRLARQTVTLDQALGEAPETPRITQAVVDAFGQILDVDLRLGSWTAHESELARAALASTRVCS
ncbi:MAG: biotin/lipoate A/B protein ligase family protein [Coriobacteriia bacterium]|nr:biotin/lipoate A/B protein ligase family protein [Coriobacteriia bacterium]